MDKVPGNKWKEEEMQAWVGGEGKKGVGIKGEDLEKK